MSDEIESVREHVGRSFTVAPEGAEPVELALTELRDLASSTRDGGGYALTWKGPSAPLLPQATYAFEGFAHEAVFLVPIGEDEDGIRYESVFN